MTMQRTIAAAACLVLLAGFGVAVSAATATVTLGVEGMTCGGCATGIEKTLAATAGVLEARVSFEKREAWVRYDDAKLSVDAIRRVISEAGYSIVDAAGPRRDSGPSCCAGKTHGGAGCTMIDTANLSTQELPFSTDLAELRTRFNADKGKVRLLMLLSPTCPMCVGGASVVQTKVLDAVKDPDVRAYAVWVPILDSDGESTVGKASTRLSDARVSRYWDGKGELVRSYARVLALGERPAWDVYLLYGPDAEWKTEPPRPDTWMHQLQGLDASRRLDGAKLAAELAALAEQTKGKGK
jgi:mercuric ion binding protein